MFILVLEENRQPVSGVFILRQTEVPVFEDSFLPDSLKFGRFTNFSVTNSTSPNQKSSMVVCLARIISPQEKKVKNSGRVF